MAKTCTTIEHYIINTKTLGGIKLSAPDIAFELAL